MFETPPPPEFLFKPLPSTFLRLWLRNPRQRLIAECKSFSWALKLCAGAEAPSRTLWENRIPHGVLHPRSLTQQLGFRWWGRQGFSNPGTVDCVRESTRGRRRKRWRKRGEQERGGEETGNTLPERRSKAETGRLQQLMRQNNEAGEVERETEREGGEEGPRAAEKGYRVRRKKKERGKSWGQVRERRTQESTHVRLTATAEKEKGNNGQEGRGGRSLE